MSHTQSLFTMATTPMSDVASRVQVKQNVSNRQSGAPTQMRAGGMVNKPSLNSRSINAPSASQRSTGVSVSMSATNNLGSVSSSHSLAGKYYSNFSNAAAISSNNYLGGEMSMNADTSKWGKMSQSNFSTGDISMNMQTMVNKAKNMVTGRSGAVKMNAQASCGDYSFSVDGGAMSVKDNFQDASFVGMRKAKTNKRRFGRTFALAALPEGAEGEWGSYNRKYVVGGNWKSNGDVDFATKLITETLNEVKFDKNNVEVVVAPTDIHLTTVKAMVQKDIKVSAQDVSQYGRGAFTGNVTADQLTDIGIKWTLTGHSERRSLFGETDKDVAVKTKIAIDNGMNVMVCIGEQLEERETG